MENPTKKDDLGGTTIFGNIHIYKSSAGLILTPVEPLLF